MKLLNTLLLLVRASAPGGVAGAVYYDDAASEPKYHDGTTWKTFGSNEIGYPDPLVGSYVVPDGRQVTYFDRFQNDGVLTITGTGYLVGIR